MSRTSIAELLAEARRTLDRLEPSDAHRAQAAGALIVDTRSGDERRQRGVIPGSLHIPLSVLEWRLDPDADPVYRSAYVTGLDQWLVLVCAHGCSSSLAAARLQRIGFARATDLVGGFEAWRAAGLPTAPPALDDPSVVPGLGSPEPS